MKDTLSIIVSMLLSTVLSADVIISGIDFQKSESIASVLKGVNLVRGMQDVVLTLDETRKLSLVDSSKHRLVDFVFAVGVDGIRMPADKSRYSHNEFIRMLKNFVKVSKEGGHKGVYIYLLFDDGISGIEGHQLLTDVCDSGITGILFTREESRKEKTLRLKRERLPKHPKPTSPK